MNFTIGYRNEYQPFDSFLSDGLEKWIVDVFHEKVQVELLDKQEFIPIQIVKNNRKRNIVSYFWFFIFACVGLFLGIVFSFGFLN